jgi:hypothetical protein
MHCSRNVQMKHDVEQLGTIELVAGIVEDGRDLFAAHAEALREDLASRLASLGPLLIAIGVFVVTALLASLAVAASLVAIGAPWWVALWAVSFAAAGIGLWFGFRARTKARTADKSLAATVDRVRDEIAQIGTSPLSTTTQETA